MKSLLTQIQNTARARKAYRRTVAELRRLPLDTALDLDIHKDDAEIIARRAVYGA